MIKRIAAELKEHAPFTALGAITGIILMIAIVLSNLSTDTSEQVFYTLHPAHVVLSAIVTTAMYRQFGSGKAWLAILIGYTGSIGIATISDSVIPYGGELLLDLPHSEAHIGFIEEWWLVNPLAFLGIAIGYFRPTTKLPHMGHVLLSTWASLFHITMALGETFNWILLLPIFLFLIIAVLIPCCVSDIIYPMIFSKGDHAHVHSH
ncbi:MAG: hypothetical protein SVM79_04080 [Chloroflexota bacterium]|nr:hypothetical protein [Chloroflexota bacterium]